jgi:hypothetical protein
MALNTVMLNVYAECRGALQCICFLQEVLHDRGALSEHCGDFHQLDLETYYKTYVAGSGGHTPEEEAEPDNLVPVSQTFFSLMI